MIRRRDSKEVRELAPDARAIALLEAIVARLDGLRDDLRSALGDLGAQSDGADVPTPDALLTSTQVCDLLQLDERSLRRLRHLGEAPKPIAFGTALRWRRRDVERWIAKRASA